MSNQNINESKQSMTYTGMHQQQQSMLVQRLLVTDSSDEASLPRGRCNSVGLSVATYVFGHPIQEGFFGTIPHRSGVQR